MGHYSNAKEINALLCQADAAGWRIVRRGGGHFRCYSPDGQSIITLPSSGGGGRGIANAKAAFRRAGLNVK